MCGRATTLWAIYGLQARGIEIDNTAIADAADGKKVDQNP